MLIRTTCAIDESVYFLTLGDSCFYLLKGESGVHLLDVGTAVHTDKLLERLSEVEVAAEQLTHVYLSNDNPARIAGVASLLDRCPNAEVYCAPELKKSLLTEEANKTVDVANKEIAELYSKSKLSTRMPSLTSSLEGRIKNLPDTETITIASDLSLRVLSTPGHSEFSSSFFIPELKFLIVDQTYGYFRGKEPPAPGADFSMDSASSSRKAIEDLEVETLGFHSIGFISGALAQKHLQDVEEGSKTFVAECKNAAIAGVGEAAILESLKESVYTSAYQDPIIQWQLDRSMAAIWKQMVKELAL